MNRNRIVMLIVICSLVLSGLGFAQSTTPAKSTAKKTTSSSPASPDKKVNINNASSVELDTLPGIGPKTAQKIVEYRKEHGHFQKAEDLMAVKGIGEKKFARLKPLITVE